MEKPDHIAEATGMRDDWAPDWSDHVFSLTERDSRWRKVRALMRRDGVDAIVCLPCTNSHGRGQADARYLSQLGENSDETTVAFPIEGEVVAWHSRPGAWPSSNWLAGVEAAPRGAGGATISRWLNRNSHYASATIAIAGLTATDFAHVRAAEGEVNWQSVETLRSGFPKARFVSATPLLGEARWQKSNEEIEFLRSATRVAEDTNLALEKYAREGVRERHVFAQMMYANAEADGGFTPMLGWVSGPQARPYHRIEQPSLRILQKGDFLSVEIEGRWGGYIAQIDQTVAIGEASPDLVDASKLSIEAFERVVDRLAPGVTMGELQEVAEIASADQRIRAGLGLHGRGTGDDGPLLIAGRPPSSSIRDIPVAEGCCFAIKPSAVVGGLAEYGRWGDTVVVTASGSKRLGTRVPRLAIGK